MRSCSCQIRHYVSAQEEVVATTHGPNHVASTLSESSLCIAALQLFPLLFHQDFICFTLVPSLCSVLGLAGFTRS